MRIVRQRWWGGNFRRGIVGQTGITPWIRPHLPLSGLLLPTLLDPAPP